MVMQRTYYYELTYCELAQLVVDSLLHALQVVRYTWSLHREVRSLWTRIVIALIKHLTFHTLLMIGLLLICFR